MARSLPHQLFRVWIALVVVLTALWLVSPAVGEDGSMRFREVSTDWGIDFRHHHGGSGQRYMVETMVGGVVFVDFDGDGDEDLLFVDGGALPGYEGEPPKTRLFRNDGPGRFVDFTDQSGIRINEYGVGGTAGDIDNDGDLDLYLTVFGANQLLRNQGDGTFVDITSKVPVGDDRWNASAAFADVDRDGDLDLYVAGYVDLTLENNVVCSKGDIIAYCAPEAYNPIEDRFFRNLGEGVYEDATMAAGFGAVKPGAGLGVVFGDVDRDGWTDLYVANDQYPNRLFHNRGDGTYDETSLLAGVGYGDFGNPEAGMGVDMGDVDGDGNLDILVTNFELETNALYRNLGSNLFIDSRWVSDIAEPSYLFLAFGVDLADFDHDGDLDLVVGNGHISDNAHMMLKGGRYQQFNQAFENLGDLRFRLIDANLSVKRVSRGLATGDLDGDGDLDISVINSNDLAEIYENVTDSGGSWLLVDLVGNRSNRYGIDSWVELGSGGHQYVRTVRTASSYLSQNAITAHFGLPAVTEPVSLQIGWPGGKQQRFDDVQVDRRLRIFE